MINVPIRLTKEVQPHPELLKRFVWFIMLLIQIVFASYTYVFFGYFFGSISNNYQWILALAIPFVEFAVNYVTLKIAYQSAEPSISGRRTMMLTCTHYLIVRFEVFLAVVVGSFATPLSTNFIIVVEYVKVIYSTIKIIYQYKHSNVEMNLEGR